MKKEKRRISIFLEVAILFLIGIIATGALTYFTETGMSHENVRKRTEFHAQEIAEDASFALKEYPAYEWLIHYWYEHPQDMDIEYDAVFTSDSLTAERCRKFSLRHPDLELRYLTGSECISLPEADQRLFAEIAYSWLITRIDQIKRSYHVDYLFCVITREPAFNRQFFLFSGADPGAVRGSEYEEVYPLGHVVTVSDSQAEAMRDAVRNEGHLADAGRYVDYYVPVTSFGEYHVLIGLTYDLSGLQADVDKLARTGTQMEILLQLMLAVIILTLILFFVLRPLKMVQHNIRRYKQTKDSDAVAAGLALIRSRNEIGDLTDDVADMVREIDSYVADIQTITADRERIVTELNIAARIQSSMLPDKFPAFPDRQDFDIFASMTPAREVGGDFYDFFLIDEDHLCMVIADVSGKGIPAALFMMASRILLANDALSGRSPAQILTAANAAICSHNREEMFVTVWLGILELSTGKLTAANAGHEYPAIRKPDGRFELFRDRHGFVIGGMEGVKYREYELMLEPGSRLFVYTDGVPEATSAEEELFGTDRMLAALNVKPDASPELLISNVRAAVDDFVKDAEQFDDLTMLCLEYRGKGDSPASPDHKEENEP